MQTPWGVAQTKQQFDEGVFWVQTAEHGRILSIRLAFVKKCRLPDWSEVLRLFGTFFLRALKNTARAFQVGGETRITHWSQGKGITYMLYFENIAVVKANRKRYWL